MYPNDRRYTKEHEWVQLAGDLATVGVTDYAQKQLGDVVYVELPDVGRSLKAHDSFGTVESVKAVSELFSPLSGEVVAVNSELAGQPERINADPHGGAWMIRVKVADPAEVSGLMDAEAYAAFAAGEGK